MDTDLNMKYISAIQALDVKNVVFVGAGFVGGPTATVLASNVKDVDVAVVDIDEARIGAWNSEKLPVFEPGLDKLVAVNRLDARSIQNDAGRTELLSLSSTDLPSTDIASPDEPRKNLNFSTNFDHFIRKADMIFLCVDTPQRRDSNGYEGAPDLTSLRRAVGRIGQVVVKHFILVEKCTVPLGTALLIRRNLRDLVSTDIQFEVLSNPEFLAEGSAVKDLENPDRVLIGAANTADGTRASQKLLDLYKHWIPCSKIITSDLYSAELSKLCANALLAQRVSSINSLSIVCERIGGDIREITKIVQSDHRIGDQMLSASVGFGGSCFPKDVAHLVYLASSLGLHEVAEYWKAVLKINTLRKESFADRICKTIKQYPVDLREVAVLGFAFKSGSNDTRNSAAIDITKRLMDVCSVRIYDPFVPESNIRASLGLDQFEVSVAKICSDVFTACEGASVVVILTDWDEFKYESASSQEIEKIRQGVSPHAFRIGSSSCSDLAGQRQRFDTGRSYWKKLAEIMQAPKLLFDGRNVVHDSVAEFGFTVKRVGKGEDESEATVLSRLQRL